VIDENVIADIVLQLGWSIVRSFCIRGRPAGVEVEVHLRGTPSSEAKSALGYQGVLFFEVGM